MAALCIQSGAVLRGTAHVPGDKSISHRAVMLGALGSGITRVRRWLASGDTLATLRAVEALGVRVERSGTTLAIHGGALHPPTAPLDCANSGTTMRLMAGILAGQPFPCTLDGSAQLRRRPMRRITAPLRQMGADIIDTDGYAPLHIRPAALKGAIYTMPVASAQVKSAVLLAGLFAKGETVIIQPGPARDHTERMLAAMGTDIAIDGDTVRLRPGRTLHPLDMDIPADLSSAAFLIVAALLLPGSSVRVDEVGLNPTRTGLLDALARMGARLDIDRRTSGGEVLGSITTRSGKLKGTAVGGADVVRMIDEFPIFAVAATQAEGVTEARSAAELRVKEVDRIAVLAGELRKLGAAIDERPDGFAIKGPQRLRGADVDAHGDHRLGMSLAVAGLVAEGETHIHGAECINDSFPGFAGQLAALGAEVKT